MAPLRVDDARAGDAAAEEIRAFIAIEPDAEVRRSLVEVLHALRREANAANVRWTRPENLHVTLRFLGQIDPRRISTLVRELRRVAPSRPPFSLELGAVHGFPSARRPRVIACEVGPEEPLQQLAQTVERGVTAAGYPPESRRFRAHLTLGRIAGRSPEPVTASVTAAGESWRVNEIVLFRSELTRSGAIHTPLERIALGGTDHP